MLSYSLETPHGCGPVPLRHPLPCTITANGTNATVTVGPAARVPTLQVGDRFQVAGAAQPGFNGFWGVFTSRAGSGRFSYEVAAPPDGPGEWRRGRSGELSYRMRSKHLTGEATVRLP